MKKKLNKQKILLKCITNTIENSNIYIKKLQQKCKFFFYKLYILLHENKILAKLVSKNKFNLIIMYKQIQKTYVCYVINKKNKKKIIQ